MQIISANITGNHLVLSCYNIVGIGERRAFYDHKNLKDSNKQRPTKNLKLIRKNVDDKLTS